MLLSCILSCGGNPNSPAAAKNQVAFITVSDDESDDVVLFVDLETGNFDVIALPRNSNPVDIELNEPADRAYVANEGNNTVAVIDTRLPAIVSMIPIAAAPAYLEFHPDGSELWVVNRAGVTIFDPRTETEIGHIDVGLDPRSVAFTSDGTMAYVPHGGEPSLSVIDVAERTVVDILEFEATPEYDRALPARHVAFSGGRALVTNRGGYHLIDTDTGAQIGFAWLQDLIGAPQQLEWSGERRSGLIIGYNEAGLVNPNAPANVNGEIRTSTRRFGAYGPSAGQFMSKGSLVVLLYQFDARPHPNHRELKFYDSSTLKQVGGFDLPDLDYNRSRMVVGRSRQ